MRNTKWGSHIKMGSEPALTKVTITICIPVFGLTKR